MNVAMRRPDSHKKCVSFIFSGVRHVFLCVLKVSERQRAAWGVLVSWHVCVCVCVSGRQRDLLLVEDSVSCNNV